MLLAAGSLLPPEPWDNTVWTTWIGALERATGCSGEALLTPLRLALTGEDSGPDLADLLPLIGRPRAASRLLDRRRVTINGRIGLSRCLSFGGLHNIGRHYQQAVGGTTPAALLRRS